jgi:hypothetical protein
MMMDNFHNIISPIESGGTVNHFGLDESGQPSSSRRKKGGNKNFWRSSSSQGKSSGSLGIYSIKAASRLNVKKSEKEENPQKKLDFETNKKRKCTCNKSLCRKNYCECFLYGEKCLPGVCECTGCLNEEEIDDKKNKHEKENQIPNTIDDDRKVSNFGESPQIAADSLPPKEIPGPSPLPDHCNCFKSNCLKSYCECKKAGRQCGRDCRCKNCKNCVIRPKDVFRSHLSKEWEIEGHTHMIRVFIQSGKFHFEESDVILKHEERKIILQKEETEKLFKSKNKKQMTNHKMLSKKRNISDENQDQVLKITKKKQKLNTDDNDNIKIKNIKENIPQNEAKFIRSISEIILDSNSDKDFRDSPNTQQDFTPFNFISLKNLKTVPVSIVDTENRSPVKIKKKKDPAELTPLQTTAMATEGNKVAARSFVSDPEKKVESKKLNMKNLNKEKFLLTKQQS